MPNLLLRMLSEPLSKWLWTALHNSWCSDPDPNVPRAWRDAWLVLLAKRRVREPRDIRLIALTDSLGRTILGLLTHVTKPQVIPKLLHLPIFAFVPGRGTLEALLFACDHCRRVRTLCSTNVNSPWQASQRQVAAFRGGLLLSFDMSQAFDRLPRQQLAIGFDWLNVDPQLSQLFLKWLHEATYHFDHRRVPCQVPSPQGVRQGCKASPLEWTIFLAVRVCRLDTHMPPDCPHWVKEHLLTYADDLLARWTLYSREDFYAAIQQVGVILDTLESLGMKINVSKSVIFLRLSGRAIKLVKKRCIQSFRGGQGLLIPRAQGPHTLLLIVNQHVHLGIKLSYYHFEDLTLAHRLHIGHIAFLRLRPWLLKRHASIALETSTLADVCSFSLPSRAAGYWNHNPRSPSTTQALHCQYSQHCRFTKFYDPWINYKVFSSTWNVDACGPSSGHLATSVWSTLCQLARPLPRWLLTSIWFAFPSA